MNVEEARTEAVRVTEERRKARAAWAKKDQEFRGRLSDLGEMWAPGDFPHKVGDRFDGPQWLRGVWEITGVYGSVLPPWSGDTDGPHGFDVTVTLCKIKKNGKRGARTSELTYYPREGEWAKA